MTNRRIALILTTAALALGALTTASPAPTTDCPTGFVKVAGPAGCELEGTN
jgi:hypothetical protein